jgi:hypothetical protein
MILIEFVEVAKPAFLRGEVVHEITTTMMLDAYPHIPSIGETLLFPGEQPGKRRVVVGIHRRYKKRQPTLNVVVTLMPYRGG